jgi:O-antigen ligase
MAHNLFVDVFVSTGLIGLMIFLFLSIACVWIFCKKNYNINTAFYIGISGFIMFSIISMFDLKFAGLQFIGAVAYFLGVIYSQTQSKLESGL